MANRAPVNATALIVLALAAAGCGPLNSTSSGSGSLPPGPTASATPDLTPVLTDPGATPGPTLPGHTDTAWGRIWDALPITFPTWPGARPTETGEGPASAILDAGAAEPAAVASFYESALGAAGFSTVSMSGPREDGSREIEATAGEAGCHARITVTPLGGTTIITILFGADCPFG